MATEIYCSKWYDITDVEDRKIIVLFLMQSQFNTRLSAYGVYDLSMETFSKVSISSTLRLCCFTCMWVDNHTWVKQLPLLLKFLKNPPKTP